MSHFRRLGRFDVTAAAAQLRQHPELWNEHPDRLTNPNFEGTSDVWLRYRPLIELINPDRFRQPFYPVFYTAWHLLWELHPIVWSLMASEHATMLGGIMLTKIPPKGAVRWHDDRGSWHAEFFDLKCYVPLEANDQCVNLCEDERMVIRAGDAVAFNNLVPHAVYNGGETDRVTLIVCMRTG